MSTFMSSYLQPEMGEKFCVVIMPMQSIAKIEDPATARSKTVHGAL